MSLETLKPQLVSELPLSVSTAQRDAQKPPPQQANPEVIAEQHAAKVAVQAKAENTEPGKKQVELQQHVKSLNAHLSNSALKFEFVEELGTFVIKVIDVEENRTIRQIPSDEMVERLKEIRAYLEQHVYSDGSKEQHAQRLKEAVAGIILNRQS